MKKKYIVAATLALFAASASAQDIYKVGLLTSTDLNGDARYVGMGGAMSALGANISAMSTNPASTAQYRRNDFSITGGVLRSAIPMILISSVRIKRGVVWIKPALFTPCPC